MSIEYFQEKQYFPKWITFLMFAILIWVTVVTFQSYGSKDFIVVLLVAFLPSLIVFLLIAYSSLFTEMNEDGIYVKLFPFHWQMKFIPWSVVEKCEVIKYSPIKEYGGWGLRYGKKGKAYNVAGNMGIKIIFKNGKSLLIGTQKEEEASEFLDSLEL